MSESIPTTLEAANSQPDQPPKTTPLTQFLLQQNPALQVQEYEGRVTAALFDDAKGIPGFEGSFALNDCAVTDLGWTARIAVTGEDRVRWLAGMTTNAIQTLSEGAGIYNFVLNAQGRIQGDLYAFAEGDRLVLQTTQAQVSRLIAHFENFIIMDDVELHPLENLTVLGLAGPRAVEILSKFGLDASRLEPLTQREYSWNGISITLVHAYSPVVPRFEVWFAEEQVEALWNALVHAGCRPAGSQATETLRVFEGTPRYGVDILEKHLAQETSQTRALNFSKGCYLGQEIVERIRSRASIHRALKQFELGGTLPLPGAELVSRAKPAGNLSSVATVRVDGQDRIFALGTVKTEALAIAAPIEYERGTARPLDAPPKRPTG